MELNRDFSAFIESFVEHEVRFLVVGGYALAVHGHPRYTKDLDIWIRADAENAERVVRAIEAFGFGGLGLSADTFLDPDLVVQLGREPQRIDILTFITGLDFDQAYDQRVAADLGGVRAPVISRADLRRNKQATGRTRDLADAETLAEGEAGDP
jgi:hypothetical protein